MTDTATTQIVEPGPVIDYPGEQPQGDAITPAPEMPPEIAEPAAEATTDGEAPEGQAEPETVVVTKGGQEYRIPKDLEAEFLFQGDYTRKTQDLAEQRRAHDAEVQAYQVRAKVQQEHLSDVATLQMLDGVLAQQQAIATGQVQASPEDVQQAVNALAIYGNQRTEVARRIDERVAQAQRDAQDAQKTRRDEAMAFAAREIPNWNPEQERTLTTFGVQQGVPERLIDQAISAAPATLKVLHLAQIGQQFLDSQRTAQKPKAKPVKVTTVGKGGAPASSSPKDDQKIEDWVAARERELAAKRKAGFRR